MVFVKVVKNKAYFKRFQVQRRRRREGKTDFQARRRLVRQAKNKYNSKKYRFVVRLTNRKAICQIIYATVSGDYTICQALSTELERYGMPCGLKNYAAVYATGLLCARRLLKQLEMDGDFKGVEEINGEEFHVEEEDSEKKPFKAILDVGLKRTCIGSRVFAALKGAADGGLHIPHSTKRFPGSKPAEEKGGEDEYDAEAHSSRIFGNHVGEYMEMLQEEDPTKYEAHFAKFVEADVTGENIEDKYKEVHSAIKEDPSFTKKEKSDVKNERRGKTIHCDGKEYQRNKRLNNKQRKANVKGKIKVAQQKALAAMEDDD